VRRVMAGCLAYEAAIGGGPQAANVQEHGPLSGTDSCRASSKRSGNRIAVVKKAFTTDGARAGNLHPSATVSDLRACTHAAARALILKCERSELLLGLCIHKFDGAQSSLEALIFIACLTPRGTVKLTSNREAG
jgi:hypothetical protein